MASVRTVLRDIADIGLDPHVAHTRCSHDGRLALPDEALMVESIHELTVASEVQAVDVHSEQASTVDTASVPEKKEEKPAPVPKKVVKPREPQAVKRPV